MGKLESLVHAFRSRDIKGLLDKVVHHINWHLRNAKRLHSNALSYLNRYVRVLVDRIFDYRFRVDTSGLVEVAKIDVDPERKTDSFHYEPTPVPALRSMLGALDIDHSKYTIVDFGSGKGRVLLLASEYPYNRILGVEFSRTLHEIAENNIRAWKSPRQKSFNITSICGDAGDFDIPSDPVVLFFFTPFRAPLSDRVIANIEASLVRNPRPIKIIFYGNPIYTPARDFITALSRLNLSSREIYSKRPFSAQYRYKGLLFESI